MKSANLRNDTLVDNDPHRFALTLWGFSVTLCRGREVDIVFMAPEAGAKLPLRPRTRLLAMMQAWLARRSRAAWRNTYRTVATNGAVQTNVGVALDTGVNVGQSPR